MFVVVLASGGFVLQKVVSSSSSNNNNLKTIGMYIHSKKIKWIKTSNDKRMDNLFISF